MKIKAKCRFSLDFYFVYIFPLNRYTKHCNKYSNNDNCLSMDVTFLLPSYLRIMFHWPCVLDARRRSWTTLCSLFSCDRNDNEIQFIGNLLFTLVQHFARSLICNLEASRVKQCFINEENGLGQIIWSQCLIHA